MAQIGPCGQAGQLGRGWALNTAAMMDASWALVPGPMRCGAWLTAWSAAEEREHARVHAVVGRGPGGAEDCSAGQAARAVSAGDDYGAVGGCFGEGCQVARSLVTIRSPGLASRTTVASTASLVPVAPSRTPARRPVGAENRVALCSLGIFMDQAAKPVPAQNPGVCARSGWMLAPGRRAPVAAVGVVLADVLIKDQPQVPFAGSRPSRRALTIHRPGRVRRCPAAP